MTHPERFPMRHNPLHERSAGILLHPTSLPGPGHQGTLGPEARLFVDFLQQAGQRIWQMLPIHPVGGGDSPYDSPSAFAGSPGLISLEDLAQEGLLSSSDLPVLTSVPSRKQSDQADYRAAHELRQPLLRRAYEKFHSQPSPEQTRAYEEFLEAHHSWVWDFALFCALKERYEGRSWVDWSPELRQRSASALEAAHRDLVAEVRYHLFLQYCFHRQFDQLRNYARERGISLMGDVPIFVAHDSVDVWANQHLFYLDEKGQKTVQAGVPPDYFSEEGQLWGNPLYRWEALQYDGYGWWIDRLRRELNKFDAIRLDHFIAFSRYWEVPIHAQTAREGRYLPGPSYDFFEKVRAALGGLPFVAEDLGIVTAEVEALRNHFELPGMKVLQFAFNQGAEAYLPHRHPQNSIVYTGTHDNNTSRGWYEQLEQDAVIFPASRQELARLQSFTGVSSSEEISWALIRSLYASPSQTAIVPLQDLLNLDEAARMNRPGIAEGNWTYRYLRHQLTDELAEKLRLLSQVTERYR